MIYIRVFIKYVMLGVFCSCIAFSTKGISSFYLLNEFPLASDLHIEALKLYKDGVLQNIEWSKVYHRLGNSDSTRIRIFGEFNIDMLNKESDKYRLLYSTNLLYGSKSDKRNYLLNFDSGNLIISILNREFR